MQIKEKLKSNRSSHFSLFRCSIDKNQPNNALLLCFYLGVYAWLSIILSIISYISIALKLFRVRRKLKIANAATSEESTPTQLVVRFVVYIGLMVFQWTPVSIYLIWNGVSPPPYLSSTFSVVTITNLGGWLNGITFFMSRMVRENRIESVISTWTTNEGLRQEKNESIVSTTCQRFQSNMIIQLNFKRIAFGHRKFTNILYK